MEPDKIITEAKAIPNREAAEEFAVRGAMIKCSFGTGFDVINLPLCHGVYSGENPLLNISDMVVGKNIYGFGMCLDGKSECKCKEYIAISELWMNPNETKLKIEKNEALLTGAQTACSSKGGIITITHSGQNAHYIKAAADQAKAIKAKKEAALAAKSTPNNDPVATEIATPIESTMAVQGVMGGVGSTIATQTAIDGLRTDVLANQNADTNNNAGNDSMTKVLTPSMIRNSVGGIITGALLGSTTSSGVSKVKGDTNIDIEFVKNSKTEKMHKSIRNVTWATLASLFTDDVVRGAIEYGDDIYLSLKGVKSGASSIFKLSPAVKYGAVLADLYSLKGETSVHKFIITIEADIAAFTPVGLPIGFLVAIEKERYDNLPEETQRFLDFIWIQNFNEMLPFNNGGVYDYLK